MSNEKTASNEKSNERTWIAEAADAVLEHAHTTKKPGEKIVCASGISPSGPIHLGNLREIMTVHLVAEELRSRGIEVEHIHSWDDFDRLRRVPAGVSEDFSRYVGQPLCDVPDPWGKHESYAAHFMAQFLSSLDDLGIEARCIRQSEAYRRGDYTEGIKTAMERRGEIFDILAEYQTLAREGQEESLESRRDAYYPFKVYCHACNTDATNVWSYEPGGAVVHYGCSHCNHHGSFSLDDETPGKLVWKVDWPMRWSYEKVDFEPGGEDHSAPGSSFTVGKRVVREIYGGTPPSYIGYTFVGMSGRSKISSSAGTSVTPSAALDILEPSIVRWLYIRRKPNQKFNIDFGKEVLRLYDEWDALTARCQNDTALPVERNTFERCLRTHTRDVARSLLPVSFRLLASAADLTQGNREQILRIVTQHMDDPPARDELAREIEPRLLCASRWTLAYQPEDERTHVREAFAPDVYETVDDEHRRGIALLLEKLDEDWSLAGLTMLVYAVPKLLRGLPIDADPDAELKKSQRDFFATLYALICDNTTGPRLPTLFLSIGEERVRRLLTAPTN